jgi:hypothetical protein
MRYGILIFAKDQASAVLGAIGSKLKTLGKVAKSAAFGTGGTGGALGNLGLGGLISGGAFGAVISAAKFAVGSIITIFTGLVSAIGRIMWAVARRLRNLETAK